MWNPHVLYDLPVNSHDDPALDVGRLVSTVSTKDCLFSGSMWILSHQLSFQYPWVSHKSLHFWWVNPRIFSSFLVLQLFPGLWSWQHRTGLQQHPEQPHRCLFCGRAEKWWEDVVQYGVLLQMGDLSRHHYLDDLGVNLQMGTIWLNGKKGNMTWLEHIQTYGYIMGKWWEQVGTYACVKPWPPHGPPKSTG